MNITIIKNNVMNMSWIISKGSYVVIDAEKLHAMVTIFSRCLHLHIHSKKNLILMDN